MVTSEDSEAYPRPQHCTPAQAHGDELLPSASKLDGQERAGASAVARHASLPVPLKGERYFVSATNTPFQSSGGALLLNACTRVR